MKIEIQADKSWNGNRLSLTEKFSAMGDQVYISIYSDGESPDDGKTVLIYVSELMRVANMLSVQYQSEDAEQ